MFVEHDIIIYHFPSAKYAPMPDVQKKWAKFFEQCRNSADFKLYVFVDDYQKLVTEKLYFDEKVFYKEWSCLAVDYTQPSDENDRSQLQKWLTDDTNTINFTIHRLGRSYRNTHNIVSQLKQIRGKYMEQNQQNIEDGGEQQLQLTHVPQHGHFIHGPQIIVKIYRVLNELTDRSDHLFLDKLINRESKMYQDCDMNCAFLLDYTPHVLRFEQSLNFKTRVYIFRVFLLFHSAQTS